MRARGWLQGDGAASAKRAVLQAAPFALPQEGYKQLRMFIVRFDTKDVCGS